MDKPTPTARAIFDHAHEIQSLAERQAYLDQACAGDSELRKVVDGLLAAHDGMGRFLETPAFGVAATADHQPDSAETTAHVPTGPSEPPTPEGPSLHIGPYKL